MGEVQGATWSWRGRSAYIYVSVIGRLLYIECAFGEVSPKSREIPLKDRSLVGPNSETQTFRLHGSQIQGRYLPMSVAGRQENCESAGVNLRVLGRQKGLVDRQGRRRGVDDFGDHITVECS